MSKVLSVPKVEEILVLARQAEGTAANAATTLVIDDADLGALASGKADLRDLYQHGKLRVNGDVMPAHQLAFLKGLL